MVKSLSRNKFQCKKPAVARSSCGKKGKFSQAAEDLIEGRIVEDTKYQYGLKIRAMKRWFHAEYSNDSTIFTDEDEFVLPMKSEHLLDFFGYITTKFENIAVIEQLNDNFVEEGHSGRGKVKKIRKMKSANKVAYSFSQVRSFKSAIVWYHGRLGLSDECDSELEKLLEGYKRKIAQLKAAGKMGLREGKNRLLFQGFSVLSKTAMSYVPSVIVKNTDCPKISGGPKKHPVRTGTWFQSIFSWCFFVLGWVMMCRSASTAVVLLSLMSWAGDCIVIETVVSKSDQTAEKEFPRHIYANPFMPWVCPFLALGVYIFCIPLHPSESDFLFPGGSQEDRFSKNLDILLESLPCDFVDSLGGKPEDIGTHSTRKGAASYVLSQIGGPNVIQVFLRCCWSLGNVADRYVFLDAGGDEFVGRSVGGLPTSDSKFATLPPHLCPEDLENMSRVGWHNVLPGYSDFPASFKTIVPYLFASVIYHQDYLRETLSSNHPLFETQIFARGWASKLKGRMLVGEGRCDVSGMVATGVPPHITILTKLSELEKKSEERFLESKRDKAEIISHFEAGLASLPERIAKEFSETFSVEGHTPLTVASVEKLVQNLKSEILQAIENSQGHQSVSNVISPPELNSNEREEENDFTVFFWVNPLDQDERNRGQPKGHPVPMNFKLPRANARDCWFLWHHGNKLEKVAPLCGLSCLDLNIKAEWSQLSRIRCVMETLTRIAVENNFLEDLKQLKKMEQSQLFEVYDRASQELSKTLTSNSEKRRKCNGIISISTTYNLVLKLQQQQKAQSAGAQPSSTEDEEEANGFTQSDHGMLI